MYLDMLDLDVTVSQALAEQTIHPKALAEPDGLLCSACRFYYIMKSIGDAFFLTLRKLSKCMNLDIQQEKQRNVAIKERALPEFGKIQRFRT